MGWRFPKIYKKTGGIWDFDKKEEILTKRSGPILESKGMRAIFQRKGKKKAKKDKIFETLRKNVQNLKIF